MSELIFHPKFIGATKIDARHYVLETTQSITGAYENGKGMLEHTFSPLRIYFDLFDGQHFWYAYPTKDEAYEFLNDLIGFDVLDMDEYLDPMFNVDNNSFKKGLFYQFNMAFRNLLIANYRQYKINSVL